MNTPSGARTGLGRREMMKLAGLTGLAATLPACDKGSGGKSGDGRIELNMVWWGDAKRARDTQKTLDLFQAANPTITVKTEYQDSSPYKDSLATRFAGGNPPDLMAMRLDSLVEYSGRGSLLELSQHSGRLDLSGLTAPAKALGKVHDKIYGVPSGLNAIGFIVDKAITDLYGVTIPDGDTWGWPDLAKFAKEVTAKSGRKVHGTTFEPYTIANLLVFVRQRGEDLFTADGRLGVTTATVTAWFEMINKMRAEGGLPPAGVIDPDNGSAATQSYIAKQAVASQIIPTNQLQSFTDACEGELKLLRMPGEVQGVRRGQSVDTPQLWSIAAKSKHPAEALALLNFIVNNEDAARATGTTRGVPASTTVAAAIAASLSADDQRASDYVSKLQAEKLPPSYPYPVGGSKLVTILKPISTEIEFKRMTAAQGAKQFMSKARKALTA